jgi:hypothetical protein
MVPYVRKSFFKHYKDGIKWLCRDWRCLEQDTENDVEVLTGFDSSQYGKERLKELDSIDDISQLSIKDNIYTHHDALLYDYALDMTKKEIH